MIIYKTSSLLSLLPPLSCSSFICLPLETITGVVYRWIRRKRKKILKRKGKATESFKCCEKGHLLSLDHNFKSSVIRSKISPSYLKKRNKKKKGRKNITDRERKHPQAPSSSSSRLSVVCLRRKQKSIKKSRAKDKIPCIFPLLSFTLSPIKPHHTLSKLSCALCGQVLRVRLGENLFLCFYSINTIKFFNRQWKYQKRNIQKYNTIMNLNLISTYK